MTHRVPESNDLPLPPTVQQERQGMWPYLIVPLSMILGALGSLSTIVKLGFDAQVRGHFGEDSAAAGFILNVMTAHSVAAVGAILIAVGLAFYLRNAS